MGEQLVLPGAKSFRELFAYPDQSVETLVMVAEARLYALEGAVQTLQENVQEDIELTTTYSGLGTAEMSAARLLQAHARLGIHKGGDGGAQGQEVGWVCEGWAEWAVDMGRHGRRPLPRPMVLGRQGGRGDKGWGRTGEEMLG